MIRPEIQELVRLGPFPASQDVNFEIIQRQQDLLATVKAPVSDDEAEQLLRLFGPDDYFGAAWTLLHLVETAPNWPIRECLEGDANEWIVRLRERWQRGRERGIK